MPTLRIEISGHTDNVGSKSYNKKLSEKRAKAVVDYLVDKGIDKSRLAFAGYGFAQPIASNDTPLGRQKNRRTEFKVLEK
jgi:outer membrane protein OmpA-like peptidoglycan-associated protein